MLYIVTALKAEAQAYVDKYKLTKSKLSNFTLYTSSEMMLIVSGMGVSNARSATQALINHKDIVDEDIYLNIGICASDRKDSIGKLLEIGSIVYEEKKYIFKETKREILCSNSAVDEEHPTAVDMESFGFYDAVIHNPAIKKFFIFKVVSDHFEPKKVTKEGSKMLIFNQINAISKILKT